MSSIKHAVISAAGLGSRLGLNQPKCLVKVGDKRIIDYQLELLQDIEDVRIVVGFMEDRVINHVKKIRPDVIFVRNPRYAQTSTLQSIYLAVQRLRDPFIILDGDVIINPHSFDQFLTHCESLDPLLAVSRANTDEAVYVSHVENSGTIGSTLSFQRLPKTEYEWTGVALLTPEMIENKNIYVYEALKKYLPMKSVMIECVEIDTQNDLSRAEGILAHGWIEVLNKMKQSEEIQRSW